MAVNDNSNWLSTNDIVFNVPPSCGFTVAGDCESLTPIPTLGQWGSFILCLLIMAFGIRYLQENLPIPSVSTID